MTARQQVRWHAFNSEMDFIHAACEFILDAAERAIAARDTFVIVLAGGDTPRAIYRQLRNAAAAWQAWHVYFGDERCAPANDAERNSRMARDEWLAHVSIPPNQIHPIPAEHGPEAASRAYAAELQGVESFDLVLLGLGEDGHTASLFPAAASQGRQTRGAQIAFDVIPVFDAPKPPPLRVSLTAQRLSHSREVAFLVQGEGKRAAIEQWRAGAALPAAEIRPPSGVDVFLWI